MKEIDQGPQPNLWDKIKLLEIFLHSKQSAHTMVHLKSNTTIHFSLAERLQTQKYTMLPVKIIYGNPKSADAINGPSMGFEIGHDEERIKVTGYLTPAPDQMPKKLNEELAYNLADCIIDGALDDQSDAFDQQNVENTYNRIRELLQGSVDMPDIS